MTLRLLAETDAEAAVDRIASADHTAIARSLPELRAALPRLLDGGVAELRAALARLPAAQTLANLAMTVYATNPETYREPDVRYSGLFVEYPTWLYLTNVAQPLPAATVYDSRLFQEAFDRIAELITLTRAHQLVADEDRAAWPELRYLTRSWHLAVRAPAYVGQAKQELDRLFGSLDDELRELMGFTVAEALRLVDAIDVGTNDALNELLREAADGHERLRGLVEGSIEPDGDHERRVRDDLRTVSDEQRAERMLATVMAFIGTTSHIPFTTTAALVAALADVPREATDAFFDRFSSAMGQRPVARSWPSNYEPLELAPLVDLGDGTYLTHLVPKLVWAVRPKLERALHERPGAWSKYERVRAQYLEDRAADFFRGLSPHVRLYQGLRYTWDEGDGPRQFELDVLAVIDTVAFVIEAKAGGVSWPARRGAPSALEELDDLVRAASHQALRASRYITSDDEVEFQSEDGPVVVRWADLSRVLPVVITLESLSGFLMRPTTLARLGVLPRETLPWVIQLHDLEIVVASVSGVGELVHYLDRRAAAMSAGAVAPEEIDWFGHYLDHQLAIATAEEPALRSLGTHSEEFDAYHLHLDGSRLTPAPKPVQVLPQALAELITALEASGAPGFAEAVYVLLDFASQPRQQIAEALADRRRRASTDGSAMLRMSVGDSLLAYMAYKDDPAIALEEFARTAKYAAKAAACLAIGERLGRDAEIQVVWLRQPWEEDAAERSRAEAVLGGLASRPRRFPADDQRVCNAEPNR